MNTSCVTGSAKRGWSLRGASPSSSLSPHGTTHKACLSTSHSPSMSKSFSPIGGREEGERERGGREGEGERERERERGGGGGKEGGREGEKERG